MSKLRAFLVVAATFLGISGQIAVSEAAGPPRKTARADARIFFTDLTDGQKVSSRFTVHFAAENMEVVPAGDAKPNSGHFHIIIDSPLPPPDQPIPNDPNHLHFGRGQQEAEIILPPGEHTLQLLMGDDAHVQHNPPVASPVVHVRVDEKTVETPRTPAPANASAFFVDLKDGATIPTHSHIKFGATGITIAPAGQETPNSGHFHLLIDTGLPDLDREIPSDPNHIHYGRAQTETDLTLTPGPHTLQILLGDYAHVPHDPPVMSKQIRVVAKEDAAKPAPAESATGATPSPPDAAVYFVYPTKGATIYPRSTIRFGLRNMGVAPAGVDKPNTGHHHLLIDVATPPLDKPLPNEPNIIHFGLGQTEKKITLTPGKHTLQLILGDYRHLPHDPPVMTERIEVTVLAPGRKIHRRRR